MPPYGWRHIPPSRSHWTAPTLPSALASPPIHDPSIHGSPHSTSHTKPPNLDYKSNDLLQIDFIPGTWKLHMPDLRSCFMTLSLVICIPLVRTRTFIHIYLLHMSLLSHGTLSLLRVCDLRHYLFSPFPLSLSYSFLTIKDVEIKSCISLDLILTCITTSNSWLERTSRTSLPSLDLSLLSYKTSYLVILVCRKVMKLSKPHHKRLNSLFERR